MQTLAPARTTDQRLTALEEANRIRVRRAAFKKAVARRDADPFTALLEPPEWMATMKVLDLLRAIPKVGRIKADRTLYAARISPSKTMGGLSRGQRSELFALLSAYRGIVRP